MGNKKLGKREEGTGKRFSRGVYPEQSEQHAALPSSRFPFPVLFIFLVPLFVFLASCARTPENVLHPLSGLTITNRSTIVIITNVLSGDTTWTESSSPVYITIPVIVPEGITLTILSNVELRFFTTINRLFGDPVSSTGALIIEGNLIIQGSGGNPVVVTDPGESGATFSILSTGNIDVQHFLMYGPKMQIIFQGGDAEFHFTRLNFVQLNDGTVLTGSRLEFNFLDVQNSVVKLTNSIFHRTSATINIGLVNKPTFDIGGVNGSQVTVRNSQFDNSLWTNYVRNGQNLFFPDMVDNYWAGITNSSKIDTRILDDEELSGSQVLYEPFLTTPPSPVGY